MIAIALMSSSLIGLGLAPLITALLNASLIGADGPVARGLIALTIGSLILAAMFLLSSRTPLRKMREEGTSANAPAADER